MNGIRWLLDQPLTTNGAGDNDCSLLFNHYRGGSSRCRVCASLPQLPKRSINATRDVAGKNITHMRVDT